MELHFGLKECAVGIVWVALWVVPRSDPDVYICVLIPLDCYVDVTGKKGYYVEEPVVQGSIGKNV